MSYSAERYTVADHGSAVARMIDRAQDEMRETRERNRRADRKLAEARRMVSFADDMGA